MEISGAESVLTRAIQAGEILTIKYHGGSQPGAVREIAPISLSGQKLRARCYTSGAVKVFVVEKIEICEEGNISADPKWDPSALPIVQYATISDIYKAQSAVLENSGWHINHELDILSLHRIRKNGTPLKGPDVSITYSEWTSEQYIDQDDDGELIYLESNRRKSARPYGVRGKNHHGASFANLDKAAELFLRLAVELSPRNKLSPGTASGKKETGS